jgi:hypothetical protein
MEQRPGRRDCRRTVVLNLGETTSNRHYIAYSWPTRTPCRHGVHDAALRDIDTILATTDIVMGKNGRTVAACQWLMSTWG